MDSIFAFIKSFFSFKKKKNYTHHAMTKTRLTGSASLTISGALERNKELVKEGVKKIANLKNPLAALDYAREEGVSSYFLRNAAKILKLIHETPGLIFPKTGLAALYLNLFTRRKIGFKTDAMFIFNYGEISACTILYNFYKWYAYRAGLPGFDEESLCRFKNLVACNNIENLSGLRYEEIINLKQTIARDREAMEFVIDFMKIIEGGQNAFGVIKNDGSANI